MQSLILLVSTVYIAKTSYAQCYFANGTALPNSPDYSAYEPCASGPTTTCCGTNRALPPGAVRDGSAGFTRDECMPNGLCQNRYIDPKNNQTEKISYWADFCTDKNVASKNCLNVCGSRYPFGNVRLTPCNGQADSDKWCCGEKTDCCSTSSVVMLAQVLGGTLSSSTANSATTMISSISTSSTSTPTSSTSRPTGLTKPTTSSSLSNGAISGIVVGVVAGIAVFATTIFFARRARAHKRQSNISGLAEAPGHPPGYQPRGFAVDKDSYSHRAELPHTPSPAELPPATPVELPAGMMSQHRR
ncbi:hypothetical protein CC86DRAFT_454161 [Ophiobolus disseminans]|uniref:Uncharacterized protein n=1 Tax=Ophiobolus disseminans TaxID=1469910 RepID=A0A6A7A686_9PLEO|nr:hypothetical protein CC86DRAFT_454161 [Ophiobolus disseminans]